MNARHGGPLTLRLASDSPACSANAKTGTSSSDITFGERVIGQGDFVSFAARA